jgi:hypothetical protein
MTPMVPVRAASTAALVTLACLAPLHASAQDARPDQGTLFLGAADAGSRSGGVLLGESVSSCSPAGRPTGARQEIPAPPRIDFSKSDNVDSVKILWPAPMKFPDGAGGTRSATRIE